MTPTAPAVSIITCAYNRPQMLHEAIVSLREQTRGDFEHLIVDNGSTIPDVRDVIAEAADEDPRIRPFYRTPNIDQPAKRWNEMIDLARGNYVGFLDDDNTKFSTWIEKMAAVLDADPTVDVVTCGFVARFADGHSEENHLNLRTAEIILERNSTDTGCFLIRRGALERIGYFPEDIRTNEDWAMVKRMHTILRCVHLRDCLATWREHRDQRMVRCRELGNDRDKAVIRGRDWPPNVCVWPVPASDHVLSDRPLQGLRAVPWVGEGIRDRGLIVCVFISGLPPPAALDPLDGAQAAVAVVLSDQPSDVDRVCRLHARFPSLWVAAPTAACDVYSLFGDRLITWGEAPPDWRVRMAQIINCVRSPRYAAVIP